MNYIAAIFILLSAMYIISFAKYNINKKNKMAAAGAMFLAFLIIVIPVIVIFMKWKSS